MLHGQGVRQLMQHRLGEEEREECQEQDRRGSLKGGQDRPGLPGAGQRADQGQDRHGDERRRCAEPPPAGPVEPVHDGVELTPGEPGIDQPGQAMAEDGERPAARMPGAHGRRRDQARACQPVQGRDHEMRGEEAQLRKEHGRQRPGVARAVEMAPKAGLELAQDERCATVVTGEQQLPPVGVAGSGRAAVPGTRRAPAARPHGAQPARKPRGRAPGS